MAAASSVGFGWCVTRWAKPKWGIRLALLCYFLLPRTAARACEVAVELESALPPELAGCVDTQRLRRSYAETCAAYGGERLQAPALRLRVSERGLSATDPDTHVLEVLAFSAERALGVRTLPVKASDCEALPNTLALVLVLFANAPTPQSAAPASPAPPRSAGAASPAPPHTDRSPLTAQAAPQPTAASEHASIALSAGAQVLFGVMPHTALALQLQAATTWQPVSLRIAAGVLWPQQVLVAEGSVRWRSYELALEACSPPLLAFAWLALRLCAGPRAGFMLARSERFALQTKGASVPMLYLGLLPEASLRLAAASSLQLGAGIAMALLRPQFFVGLDGGERVRVFDQPALLRAALALSLTQIF